ncbi:SAM-dependent methyltransferase [Coraliomargarita parva]|uniref:SAM-dependent methyltransferase n=1 Tax=Coraliomargarita parva TaxID=3014050 RepID=UPI0022B5D4EB|nr:SAM-dependent methyltransferase [Coraliomargarita parva]
MSAHDSQFIERFKLRSPEGTLNYRDYIDLALYDPDCGYYTAARERVGRSGSRDFYTAESLGTVFARLVVTAAEDLLGPDRAAASSFVEIAAEPETSLLSHLKSHPFTGSQTIRQGDAIEASGPVVIFANEWLDALPFHRLVFREGSWHERGVTVNAEGTLEDCLLEAFSPEVAAVASRLPELASEGYELDLPLEAEHALRSLLAQDWNGLLLLFDYGKSWAQLCEACPAGTARCFYRHTSNNDLLARPGQQDITCDICWDPLEAQLRASGCKRTQFETQESFLVQRAARAAEAIVMSSAGRFSEERQTLMELLHPAHMGLRFQVLWGIR